jgi:hypothetical protein
VAVFHTEKRIGTISAVKEDVKSNFKNQNIKITESL